MPQRNALRRRQPLKMQCFRPRRQILVALHPNVVMSEKRHTGVTIRQWRHQRRLGPDLVHRLTLSE